MPLTVIAPCSFCGEPTSGRKQGEPLCGNVVACVERAKGQR